MGGGGGADGTEEAESPYSAHTLQLLAGEASAQHAVLTWANVTLRWSLLLAAEAANPVQRVHSAPASRRADSQAHCTMPPLCVQWVSDWY